MEYFLFTEISGGTARLSPEEAAHCLKVLRHSVGDRIRGTDGHGMVYEAEIAGKAPGGGAELRIIRAETGTGEPDAEIRFLLPLLKTRDRLEFMLEKTIELGATDVRFYVSERTERARANLERLLKIRDAAAKQSLRCRFPDVQIGGALSAMLAEPQGAEMRILARAGGAPLLEKLDGLSTKTPVWLATGPEGDFSDEETEAAQINGWQVTGLGINRLRAETAALHLLSSVKTRLQY